MYCKNCLAPLNNEDTYCKVCGKPVEKNNAYPTNEEIIKNYNVEEQKSIFPTVEQSSPIFPTQEQTVRVEQPQIKPVQTLEQTNVVNPVTNESVNVQPVVSQSATPTQVEPFTPNVQVSQPVQAKTVVPNVQVPSPTQVEPFTPNMEAPVQIQPRPEPLPIVNKKDGISKKVFVLGIIIAVIATALIATLISIPVISSKVEAAKEKKEENVLTPVTVTKNRVLLSKYSFEIPEGFTYKINGSQLIVEKTATKEAMSLQIGNETYANLKSNLTLLKTNLTSAKWTVGKITMDQNIKNRVYLEVQAAVNNQKVMIAYTKANASQVFAIVYLNPSSKEYPLATIETFNDIVNSVEEIKSLPTTNIANFTKNKLIFPKTTK